MNSEGEGRSELLDLISDVKAKVQDKLGLVDFPIPQFILLGKQSVGKSRLIESLAGEVFNFVSGTLGSRRPTILEFRNSNIPKSRWYVMQKETGKWDEMPISQVLVTLGNAHESLGANVSEVPINVKVESPHCVDMQITDLPGFREFALDDSKQRLADQIEKLNKSFMKNPRNIMICVEEAGDAANLATLTKCKREDPKFERTILVRNKLDKYYRDLTRDNVNDWLNGFGDLPDHLPRFAVTLPHWKEGVQEPPESFVKLRDQMNADDIEELKSRGASEKFMNTIGYKFFAKAMSKKIEQLFADAIGPVLKKMRELKTETDTKLKTMQQELDQTNPKILLNTVKEAGINFGHALNHVMEGFVRSETNRLTLEEELREFHAHHESLGSDFILLPSEDFSGLDDYIDCLRNELRVPAMDVEINGGAQFRRLMFEVEVCCRFAEICVETKKKDVIQARGVSMHTLTWQDVVVKLLTNEAHIPMRKRIQYVGERIKFFFYQQKPVILDFMAHLPGSADEHLYSSLYLKTADLMNSNETVKNMIYDVYDRTVDHQLDQFLELFFNTLTSTFANPWVFLKKNSASLEEADMDEVCLPSFEDTKMRIPQELDSRSGVESMLVQWLADIPNEPQLIDDAVDKTQMMLLKTFQFIRAQIADQIELFAESFFKLPMLRRLEEEMCSIKLHEVDKDTHLVRRQQLEKEMQFSGTSLNTINECIERLQNFAIKCKDRHRRTNFM